MRPQWKAQPIQEEQPIELVAQQVDRLTVNRVVNGYCSNCLENVTGPTIPDAKSGATSAVNKGIESPNARPAVVTTRNRPPRMGRPRTRAELTVRRLTTMALSPRSNK